MNARGQTPGLGMLLSTGFAILLTACGSISAPPSQANASTPASPIASATPQRALVLGGGGPVGRAWEIGILKGLKDAGIDLIQADLVVATSAGASLGTQIRAGKPLDSLYGALIVPVSAPAAAAGPPAYDPAYAEEAVRPVVSITSAVELTPALRVEVGRRALAATKVVSETAQLQAAAASLGDIHEWPPQLLKLAAGDVADGTMRLFDSTQGVPIERAVAASTANPATGKTPISIGDRRYMDGAVGGTNIAAATGYGAILVLMPPALLRPEVARQQVEAMRSEGAKVIGLEPDADSLAAMGPDRFDLTRVKPAAEAALRQAEAVAAEVRNL